MGNAFTCCFKTAIEVRQRDGSIRYYKPPVCAMDILKEQPENIVVSYIKGKMNILASDLYLLPGCKYHIISPDTLLSTTESNARANSDAMSRLSKPSSPKKHTSLKSDRQPRCKPRSSPTNDDATSTLNTRSVSSLSAATPDPLSLAVLRSNSFKKARAPDVHHATSDNAKRSPSPRCSKLTLPSKRSSTPTRQRNFTKTVNSSNAELELAAEQPKRKSFNGASRKSPGKSIIKSQAARVSREFSKEKRLQDMIKGADTQWKRILKSEHTLMIEGTDSSSDSIRHPGQSAQCLPFRSPFKSFGQKDRGPNLETVPAFQYHGQSPSPQLRRQPSPRRTPESFVGHAVLDDRQLKQADDRRRDLQQMLRFRRSLQRRDEAQGDPARRPAYEEMEESLDFDESPKPNVEPLRRKIDAMEHEFLLSPSPRMASSQPGRNIFLHKLAGADDSMREFPKFSSVER